ncbi:hypothetical protein ES288_A10G038500v1 [Gossypium darwinii]|uniref:FCP1 homology domain-containing protein n=1 Tax=Gossypium darwinii TaxID=34276 RepID=A0A5D2EVR7_GOSDA|nr:hypothetical protein ES288_A10G038500v1 [Gossypium darwinii]
MSFKVNKRVQLKSTMRYHRLFRCQHLHRVHHPQRRSYKSIHKCQCRILQFLFKLAAGPRRHQCFVILRREKEPISSKPNVEPRIKLKFSTSFSPVVPRATALKEEQRQAEVQVEKHQHSLPPLVSSKKRTVVLDLDEPLYNNLHASDPIRTTHSTTGTPPPNYDFMITPTIEGVTMNFYVLKRPGVDKFLEAISKKYEVVVFTAGLEQYASLLLDVLDPKGLISYRLYRDSCKPLVKRRFAKDLSTIGRDLENVVIVDDNPRSYALQPANAIPIKRFVDDVEDKELEKLLGFFERYCDGFEDMREAVKQYLGGANNTTKPARTSSSSRHHSTRDLSSVIKYHHI